MGQNGFFGIQSISCLKVRKGGGMKVYPVVVAKMIDDSGRLIALEQKIGLRVRRPLAPYFIGELILCWDEKGVLQRQVHRNINKPSWSTISRYDVGDVVCTIWSPAVESRPRLSLQYLRRVQALAAWINARCDGLLRHRDEIIRQQAKWQEALNSEEAVASLGGV